MRKQEELESKILKTIQEYNLIQNEDKLIIGVSGGPDSICLLDILNKIQQKANNPIGNFTIEVAHINHQIRKEANEDEEYVETYCKKNNIKFHVKRIDVEKFANTNKIGTEEAGRKIRYEFFEEILQKTNANKIVTAHNKNDNAETVLMNIIRGSGTKGLKGIEPIRQNKYIRPLIQTKRIDIEKYCEQNKLNPRIDKTNKENIYTRNKIRNLLIPYLEKEFNPNIIETINRLSEISKQENEYLEEKTIQAYKQTKIQQTNKQVILDLKKFQTLEPVIKNRLIPYIINNVLKIEYNIQKIHIEDIIKLCNNNIGNKHLVPNKKIKILVKKHQIFFITNI